MANETVGQIRNVINVKKDQATPLTIDRYGFATHSTEYLAAQDRLLARDIKTSAEKKLVLAFMEKEDSAIEKAKATFRNAAPASASGIPATGSEGDKVAKNIIVDLQDLQSFIDLIKTLKTNFKICISMSENKVIDYGQYSNGIGFHDYICDFNIESLFLNEFGDIRK